MTPTRSGSNYSIQSSGSGPGHSSHKSKRQECQLRGEETVEDYRAYASSQRLSSTFDTLFEIMEADMTTIPVSISQLPCRSSRNIPVSVQELVNCGKAAGVGTSSQLVNRKNGFISSSEESLEPRKYTGGSGRMDFNFLQGASENNKSLVENPKHVIRGSEEGQNTFGSSKASKSAKPIQAGK
ncbi:hypothetical protein O181_026833 [Austropuccinia psidii MF-1]|uniref:Uncharacterized protein n=1 Tax=Austropuccinia psidii MF-1 TaxID=1389203 RepID=A0A9Q3H0D2_9BASI|nr:hypothetical protein [Austropuccinia psidii MF-1]